MPLLRDRIPGALSLFVFIFNDRHIEPHAVEHLEMLMDMSPFDILQLDYEYMIVRTDYQDFIEHIRDAIAAELSELSDNPPVDYASRLEIATSIDNLVRDIRRPNMTARRSLLNEFNEVSDYTAPAETAVMANVLQESLELFIEHRTEVPSADITKWVHSEVSTDAVCIICVCEFSELDRNTGYVHNCTATMCDNCWEEYTAYHGQMTRCPICRDTCDK